MEVQYKREYSYCLGRDMEFKVYGNKGLACLYIPCQNGRFFDFENFGMADHFRHWIESGAIQVFSVDTVDEESVSATWKAPRDRILRQEAYFHYLVDELVPHIYQMNWDSGWRGLCVMGFSMGAYHAANLYFRRPDIFKKALCLSGVYKMQTMMNGYMDELVYANSPVDFLRNMPFDHPYIEMYNRNQLIVCSGQGAWEDLMIVETHELKQVLEQKNIHAWIDFWGQDVSHDWYWWKRQTEYFVPKLL